MRSFQVRLVTASAVAASAAAMGCGGEARPEATATPRPPTPRQEVVAAIRRIVHATNRNDMAVWCRSFYFAGDDDAREDGFLAPEGTFDDMSPEEQESCLRQDAFDDAPDIERLSIEEVEVKGKRATAMISYRRRGNPLRQKLFLRRIDGRWLVQFSVR